MKKLGEVKDPGKTKISEVEMGFLEPSSRVEKLSISL